VANKIDNYLAARNILLGENQNPYLLAGHKQNKLSNNRVRFVFHQAVKNICLVSSEIKSKNICDLRKKYAINPIEI
jgi:hypothetical protein